MTRHWAIVPFLSDYAWDLTQQALRDLLDQEGAGEVRVLGVASSPTESVKRECQKWMEKEPRLLFFFFEPALLSLSAGWNCALRFVWAAGGTEALVCNNDVRLHPRTLIALQAARRTSGALFVSAVGVTPEQYNDAWTGPVPVDDCCFAEQRGGPDFSCYLISKECHEKYPFDEGFTPAYCEDLDLHRRMMLGGDGERIFSVNVPYLHIDRGSGTLKAMGVEERAELERRITLGSREHYKKKWGAGANSEVFLLPFEQQLALEPMRDLCPRRCVTTPELQAHGCGGRILG